MEQRCFCSEERKRLERGYLFGSGEPAHLSAQEVRSLQLGGEILVSLLSVKEGMGFGVAGLLQKREELVQGCSDAFVCVFPSRSSLTRAVPGALDALNCVSWALCAREGSSCPDA